MPKRDPTKEKYWRRVFRQWQRSGLTGRDFCAQHGLPEANFYAWRRAIARRDQEPRPALTTTTEPPLSPARPAPVFQQLALPAAAALPPAIEVVVATGRRLRVSPGFDADLLRQLLRLVEEPPC
jgi:hypothetical protein